MDEAALAIHADVDLPLRGPAATSRSTTACPCKSGASPDPSPSSRSVASGALGLHPRRGGAWCSDQGGIDDRALLHCHAIDLEVGSHDLKDLLAEIMLLQQVPEHENRGLIRDPIADHVDPSETAHRRHLDQCILHRWFAEVVPLLHEMDAQHALQRIRRPFTPGAGLGIVGLNQIKQCFPWHHLLHLAQKSRALGSLLGGGLLVITVGEALRGALSELLAAHEPSPHLRLHGYFRADGLGFARVSLGAVTCRQVNAWRRFGAPLALGSPRDWGETARRRSGQQLGVAAMIGIDKHNEPRASVGHCDMPFGSQETWLTARGIGQSCHSGRAGWTMTDQQGSQVTQDGKRDSWSPILQTVPQACSNIQFHAE